MRLGGSSPADIAAAVPEVANVASIAEHGLRRPYNGILTSVTSVSLRSTL